MKQSSKAWPYKPMPFNPEAHVITNIGFFTHCRQDNFCRCRRCKPTLVRKENDNG